MGGMRACLSQRHRTRTVIKKRWIRRGFRLEIASDTHTEAVNPTTSTREGDGLGDVPIGIEVIELGFHVRV